MSKQLNKTYKGTAQAVLLSYNKARYEYHNQNTDLYHSEAGDNIAEQELTPVIVHYNSKENPAILEIGTSFGRNLLALSKIKGATVTACDIDSAGLSRAQERIQKYRIANVQLVKQTAENALPFANAQFDVVVIWQVFEHIFNPDIKQAIIHEALRVTRPGGIIIIETPNQLFPIDHHDTDLPFVHWIFSPKTREKIIQKIRKNSWPASRYMTLGFLQRALQQSPRSVTQVSKIYFQERYADIFKNWGGTRQWAKKIFFTLYFPFYCILRVLGYSGDLFCPSLRIVLRVTT